MEKLIINFNGDIYVHFDLGNDMFDDDIYDPYDDPDEDEMEDEYPEMPGYEISVSDLPADVDREAVEAVLEAAAQTIKSILEQTPSCRDGDCHERI